LERVSFGLEGVVSRLEDIGHSHLEVLAGSRGPEDEGQGSQTKGLRQEVEGPDDLVSVPGIRSQGKDDHHGDDQEPDQVSASKEHVESSLEVITLLSVGLEDAESKVGSSQHSNGQVESSSCRRVEVEGSGIVEAKESPKEKDDVENQEGTQHSQENSLLILEVGEGRMSDTPALGDEDQHQHQHHRGHKVSHGSEDVASFETYSILGHNGIVEQEHEQREELQADRQSQQADDGMQSLSSVELQISDQMSHQDGKEKQKEDQIQGLEASNVVGELLIPSLLHLQKLCLVGQAVASCPC